MSIEPYIVRLDTLVRETVKVINAAPLKIAIVVDETGRVVRTVTDGDIRRGLLQGIDLKAPVSSLPGRAPVTCPDDADSNAVAYILSTADVRAVIRVDADGMPTGLADRANTSGMIFMSPPHIGTAELDFVKSAFKDNWVAPAGPNLELFEQQLQTLSGRTYALALSSGTAALHLAMRVFGVERGDRVYVSDATFVASVQPVLYQQAQPVLIDSEPHSWNMSPDALERKLERDAKDGKLPRAIILVHLYGQPAEVKAIRGLADRFGVALVEDAAESLGASYGNQPSGAHGDLAAFSFNGNKIITTSGGGALVGDCVHLLDLARNLSTQGREPYEHYQHSQIAYNYRMSNVLAGIGIGQLQLLSQRVDARRNIFERYHEGLSGIAGVDFQNEVENSRGNRWLSVITLDPRIIDIHPFQMMRELRKRGIETRPGWKPMHMQPLCENFEFEPHSATDVVSSRIFLQSLCLPSGSSMTPAEQFWIIEQIKKILAGD